MQCPSCSTDNADHRKFCKQCGASLGAACASCGSALEPDERFCGECGSAVGAAATATPAPAPPIQHQTATVAERRVVSVLFADLVGFTPLSESRDAESVRELLSGYFDVARTVIARYGGTIEKFIGDAVMAVWGVPSAHEDDAERCVRAALELVEAVSDYGDSHGAAGLSARAGVVTGEVAVTLGATGEGMVAGDAVNTAARVQAAADRGGVLVDDVTRQVTARAIGFADSGEHVLKGKAEPMRLWRATRVVAAVGGSERVDGLEATCLGRDRELRQLKDAFHEVLDSHRATLVSVVGAAGVGKSRLRWELFKYGDGLVTEFLYHAGRCLPYGEGVAYWALAETVRARLGITEDEAPEQVAAKLDEGLHRWVTDEADRAFLRPRLGVLLGVAEPGLARDELFAGWRLWFERLSEEQPVMLVIEDVQWADAGLLDFLDQLLEWSADHALFVVTLSRPELLERRPTWGSGRRNALTVMLDPLPDDVMNALLDELVPGLPDEVRERIVAKADGIPLYAVELVRSLIDRDLVQPVDGVYRLVGAVDALEVPASLTSLVAARIDALPPDERALVQSLAVLGGSFPRAAAAAVTNLDPHVVDGLLTDLVRREILRVRTDRLSPDRGQYAFTQALLRQVAYDTLARRDRKIRHVAVAQHLRASFPDDGADVAEMIAQHYLDAYRALPDDEDADELRAEAARTYARAGQRALNIGATEAAEHAFETAAELSADAVERTALLEQSAEAAAAAGRFDVALKRFEAAAEAREAGGDTHEAARLRNRAAYALMQLGRLDEAREVAGRALVVLQDGGPTQTLADVHSNLAGSFMFAGRRAEAAPHVEAALELAEALRLPDVLATAAIRRGLLLITANRPQEALVNFEWAVALAEKHGLGRQGALAHLNAGDVCLQDDLPGAIEHSQAAAEHARRSGQRAVETISIGNLAMRRVLAGSWDVAEQLCRDLLAASGGVEHINGLLAILYTLRGDVEAARAHLARVAAWESSEDVQARGSYAAVEITVAIAGGEDAAVFDRALPAIREMADGMGPRSDSFRWLWPVLVHAALELGELERADELVGLLADRPVGQVPAFLQAELFRFRARLAAARGDHGDVDGDFERAEQMLRDLDYPYWRAEVEIDRAGWLIDQGRTAAAVALLDEAKTTLERLGAQLALARCDRVRARVEEVAAVAAT